MKTREEAFDIYLCPTRFINSDEPTIINFAHAMTQGKKMSVDRAIALFYAVRDGIRYNPYQIDLSPERFNASTVLAKGEGWCVEKALVLAAACRVLGIPARLRFATVRNHLASERLIELMKTDLFVFHGYNELYLEGKWVKATPTFDRKLCRRFQVRPLEFDGVHDSIFHEYDQKGGRHMEYVHDYGSHADLPLEKIIAEFKVYYPHFFERGGL